jgi:hypothetical protein
VTNLPAAAVLGTSFTVDKAVLPLYLSKT